MFHRLVWIVPDGSLRYLRNYVYIYIKCILANIHIIRAILKMKSVNTSFMRIFNTPEVIIIIFMKSIEPTTYFEEL